MFRGGGALFLVDPCGDAPKRERKMDLKKLALGAGAAILTSGLIGGAAFAALAPAAPMPTAAATIAHPGQADGTVDEARKPGGGLKAILDKLVIAGTINQGQEDAILGAAKDAAGAARREHASPKGTIGDLLKTASTYLGLEAKDLATQLRAGKSLGEIAAATKDKTRDGLVAALTDAATAKIDAAVTAKKLTADQATKFKAGLAAHVTKLVDHKAGPRPEHPKKP